MPTWKPTEKPYRVRFVSHDSTPGLYGWSDRVEVYATLFEAWARASEPMKAHVYETQVDYAQNAATWMDNGRWRKIGERKRKEEFKFRFKLDLLPSFP